MFGCQRLARPVQRDEILGPVEIGERQIGCESLLGNDEAVLRLFLQSRAVQKILDRYPFEGVIESAPGRDAVDVALHGFARQREKLVPRQREGALDET